MRALPNHYYTRRAEFLEEREQVFSPMWVCIGFASDAPNAGDVQPLEFMELPLLMVRDSDNTLRVFHNVCRHRGHVLVSERGTVKQSLRCPYHSWTYTLEGKLARTPNIGGVGINDVEGFDRQKFGLVQVDSVEWNDLVFINLSGNAPAFEDFIAPLEQRWKPFWGTEGASLLRLADAHSSIRLEVQANWKLAVENYCESYHLPWVHPGLNSYSRLEDHYNIEEYGAYSGQGTLVYRQLEGANGAKFADFEGLDTKWDTAAEYLSVYPNVLLGMHRDHAFAIVLVPKGPEETEENIHLYYATPETDEELRAKNTEQWKVVFEEDIFVVEGMQRGRHGVNFDGGRFSPAMDGPTHCFHDWVAGKVNERRAMANAAE